MIALAVVVFGFAMVVVSLPVTVVCTVVGDRAYSEMCQLLRWNGPRYWFLRHKADLWQKRADRAALVMFTGLGLTLLTRILAACGL